MPRAASHRSARTRRAGSALSILALALVLVPAGAPLCASGLGVCALPEAAPPVDAHCPLAAAGGGFEMDCCVSDAAPQGPAPAVPGSAESERPLPGPAAAVVASGSAVLLVQAPPPAPAPGLAAERAASAVPLYTLLSTLLS